ncbi:MAG: murein transglycosylase A [Alphaproteobacteria bacterium]
MRFFLLFLLLIVTACDEAEQPAPPPEIEQVEVIEKDKPPETEEEVKEKPPELILSKVSFSDLPDWEKDDLKTFALAFDRSCSRIVKRRSDSPFGVLKESGTYSKWQSACKAYMAIDTRTSETLRMFIESHFTPHQVRADEEPVGLFTGYYEASLKGSRKRKAPYLYPLHKRPDDLVMVQLGDFRKDLKGTRIAGRVKNGRLKPYEKREDIVAGKWPHNDEVLIWVDSAVDAFFVQIQGSGLVQMDDGSTMRIGYAGQNGHPYYAIGRELIKIGALTKQNVSMQSIRAWLENNPSRADEIMNTNKSYVFFREIKGDGPLGAEGVALIGGRSLAVDRTLISYGVPIWVDIEKPVEEANAIRRLMIAQDTGGAIRGPVRGDVFWGYGDIAEEMAGKMKSKGRYWVLLPKVAN